MATTIYTKTAAGQTAFTTAEQTGEYLVEYPLGESEPTARIVSAPFECFRANYSRPAPNATLSYDSSTFYFLDDVAFTDRGASLIRWTRRWATVPASWSEPLDTVFTFPSFIGANTFGTTYAISGCTISGANLIFANATSSGIAAGDSVFAAMNYTRNGIAYSQTFRALAVATTNSSQTTLPGVLFGSGSLSSISGYLAKSLPARTDQLSALSAGRIVRDYALSSVTSLNTDLPLADLFAPMTSAGVQVNDLTATTIPSSTTYATLIASRGEIVTECTRSRYLGNIFVRETKLVVAI